MYSLLLMSAMAGGVDTAPSFGGHLLSRIVHGCTGCTGCHGTVVTSCYGSNCHGCWGASCHGVTPRSSCYGCWGSSCHGCWGASCHGCWGSSCHGCWGASCHGCTGSVSHGVSYYDGAVIVMPSTGTAKIDPEDGISANLIVALPANAKLFVDGQPVAGDSTSRKFHTPKLARGKQYYYELKAEVTIGGKPIIEERKVIVTAGETVTERFEKLVSAVADGAKVAAK